MLVKKKEKTIYRYIMQYNVYIYPIPYLNYAKTL